MDKDFLDDILPAQTAVEAPEVQTAPEPTPEPETASEGPQRDEKGRFAAKTGVEPETDTVPPTDKLPKEDYKAIREEREKRQAAEARITALEQQLQSLQAPQEPPAPPPSIWEDEQGWQQHFGGQVAQQAAFNARLDMSEMLASQAHEDFDAVKAKFLEMAQSNPALAQQALQQKHPWEAAYRMGKNAMTAEELGATNVSELEAKIEARIRAELAAQAPAPATPAIPTSLADAQSARGAGQGAKPLTLDDIVGWRR